MSEENEMQQGNDGGSLRKELEKALAKNKELSEKLTGFEQKERHRSVESYLKDKGLNPKLARFVSAEDSEPEKLDAWIKDNAELFGPAVAGDPSDGDGKAVPQGEPGVPQESVDAFQQIQRVNEVGAHQPVDLSALQAQIKAAKNPEDFRQIMSQYKVQ